MQVVKELQRRNVFRVTIGYVVACWLLLQVADVILDNIGAPDWVFQTIMLVLALGFPIVVFFSWAYEVTPEGIKRESEVDRSESITHVTGRKLDRAIIFVLVLAVGYFAVDKYLLPGVPNSETATLTSEDSATDTSSEPGALPEQDKSIAVLPFVNMSGDESSTYFSDGLADTVLHMLAQVDDLRVAARTSSFQFRDQTLGIEEIGQQLNVSSILEGSVQKAGDKIRITAQLIDVSNGFHLWSGNFDRDLNDVFAIQDEIAAEVVAALKLSLLGESSATLASDRTENLDAYTEYLLAVDKLSIVNSENLSSALSHLQEAIRLDPTYARAYSTLGRTYLLMASWGSMGNEQAIAAARNVATRALDMDPTSAEALAVLGRAATRNGDFELAGELLVKAIELAPNNVVALDFYAPYLLNVARPKDAVTVFRKMLHLDPLSEEAHMGLAGALISLDQFDQARDVVTKYMIIQPDSVRATDMIAGIDMVQGNFAAAISNTTKRIALNPDDPDPEPQFWLGQNYLDLDMPEEASLWFDRAIEVDAQHPTSRSAPLLLDYYRQEIDEDSFRLARALLAERIDDRYDSRYIALLVLTEYGAETDRNELVLDSLDNLYPHLFDDPPRDLDKDLNGLFFVGHALLQSGDADRGMYMLNTLDELAAPYRSAYGTSLGHVILTSVLGDVDGALALLAEYEQRSRYIPLDKLYLERSSLFDGLREDPVFIDYLAGYRALADEQRQLLQAMLQDSSGN